MESGERVHKKSQRKVVVIGWDDTAVDGADVSIQVEGEEKRTVKNDSESNLFFPDDFVGTRTITIRGSKGGELHGTIEIE